MGSTGSFLEIRRAGKETTYSRDNEGDENDALRQKKSLLFESAYQRQLTTSPSIPASAFIILVLSSFISFSRLSRLMRLSFPSNIFPRLHSVSPFRPLALSSVVTHTPLINSFANALSLFEL